jgi:hypothetical protein
MLSKLRQNASLAALVVAVVALFVALSGIAGALPGKNKVNSGDIKNNSVKSADVKNNSLTGNDIDESKLKIPAVAVPRTTFGATINAIGPPAVGSTTLPGTTVSQVIPGVYRVTFTQDVRNCVTVANLVSGTGGETSSEPFGGQQPNSVLVVTSKLDGTQAAESFSVVVTC